MPFLQYLHAVAERRNLGTADAFDAMEAILAGEVSAAQIAAFLTALRMKGETVDELVGFARAMRKRAVRLDVGLNGEALLDTCGTGGDGQSTFNISTIAAFVAAGAGVRVAKHGNRSASSQCGSADLLESLGILVSLPPKMVARAIREVGIGFLFAPLVHTAMKHAQPVRVELKMRTVFNLLGPLTNPAGATAQLVGAPSEHAAELMAGALAQLGLERGFVVHGSDGLDEITTTGLTLAYEIGGGRVEGRELSPEDFGVERAGASELKGADPETNAVIARAIFQGAVGPQRDIVLVNASAALVAAGRAWDFREGMELARRSIDSGAAWKKVEDLARFG
ncbi:MAG TPA: anthranilate phosphoribosyltransferase [Bryobacteraceae bacterium]|nr:anthranilate phosphoribosyltransferase [Bryobacteraceae bacterium]